MVGDPNAKKSKTQGDAKGARITGAIAVDEADVTWKQTDYGGWVAKVDKLQLLDFITYCYGTDPKGRVLELIQYVNGLDDNKIYGLVAEEY